MQGIYVSFFLPLIHIFTPDSVSRLTPLALVGSTIQQRGKKKQIKIKVSAVKVHHIDYLLLNTSKFGASCKRYFP